jgi:protein-tyrosine-phosphatase/predicted ATP-grasp superfamily ATP-dependent carboligase
MTKGPQSQPVLILGASPRISVSMARSLHRHGIPVEIASFQPEESEIRSRAVRQFHRLPARRQNPEAFTAALLALVRDKQFDLILPAGDPSLKALADLYDQLGPARVGCPPPRAVERVLNKTLTLETAQRCGIRIPFTCTITTSAEFDAIAPQLRFPVVVKPEKKGASAFRVFYFNTLPELSSALSSHDWGSVLLQEYCPGVGVGVEILIHKGECVAKFQHRRLKEAPVTGGVAILAVAEEPDPELLRSSMELLRALEWEGVAMVEFRVDRETGSRALMEVNGRFWGSVSFPIAAGVDFPFYYWQLFHGEQPHAPDRYSVGMRWRWSPGYLDRMQSIVFRSVGGLGQKASIARELLQTPADFSPFVKEALWSWSDPFPFIAEITRSIWSLLAVVFKSGFRRVAPRRLMSYRRIYSRLDPQARRVYRSLRIREALGMHSQGMDSQNGRQTTENDPAKANSFLFICFGNLMRSPMAEAMLKHVLAERGIDGIVVQSAGLHAVPGREAHEWALAVSRELGVPLDGHRARRLTPELASRAEVIFAMDFENVAELETLYPGAKRKIFLLSRYAEGKQRNREIPDPYFGNIETTRRCYAVLGECVDNLVREIEAAGHSKGSLSPSRSKDS